MTSSISGESVKWRVIPFLFLFLVTIAVLLGIYRFRDTSQAEENAKFPHTSRARSRSKLRNWEDVPTYDRWLVVSSEHDLRYMCALIEVSIELNWRPLIVGNNVTCCRRACVLVDDAKVESSKYDIAVYYRNHTIIRRNVAYLYAIEHGARHIFDAYPETFITSGIAVPLFKSEMHRQLQHLTLDVALGLVLERPYTKKIYNPYAHFGRSDLWTNGFRRINARDTPHHNYRICEVRPPSIEKFMEVDDGFVDAAAPPLTLPGNFLAPFSSKNTMYALEAFWGLALLPGKESHMPAHLRRSLWNQALLGNIAGSVKLSLSSAPTIQPRLNKTRKDPGELRETADGFASYLLKWTCASRSTLGCIQNLAQNMQRLNYISEWEGAFLEHWITDLKRLRYLEPPVIPRRRGYGNPCLGADALYGVSFYPALAPKNVSDEIAQHRVNEMARFTQDEQLLDNPTKQNADPSNTATTKKVSSNKPIGHGENKPHLDVFVVADENGNGKAEASTRLDDKLISFHHGEPGSEPLLQPKSSESLEFTSLGSKSLTKEFADYMCPGFSTFYPYTANVTLDKILLIVAISSSRFELIPMFEVMYRHQFKNILYCGAPHESIEIFLRKYQTSEDRSFTFLPIHTKHTYECLIGALEMGYKVDGYLMTTEDTLLESWNLPYEEAQNIWFGGDKNAKITARDWRSVDPGAQKVPRSADGTLKALEFLRSALIGSYEDTTFSKLVKRSIDVVRTENIETIPHELSRDDPDHEQSDEDIRVKFNVDEGNGQESVEVLIGTSTSNHEKATHEIHALLENDNTFSLPEIDNKNNITVEDSNENNLIIDTFDELFVNTTTNVLLENVPDISAETDLKNGDEQNQNTSSVTDETDYVDEVDERPISELLRKILVATRNGTQETSTVPIIPAVSASAASADININQQTLSQLANSTTAVVEDSQAIDLQNIDLSSAAESSNQSDDYRTYMPKPADVTNSTDISSEHFDVHHDLEVIPTMITSTKSTTDLELNRDMQESEPHQSDHQSKINESASEALPVPTESPVSSNLTTTESLLEHSTTEEPAKKRLHGKHEEERGTPEHHVEELFANLMEVYAQIKENLGVTSENSRTDYVVASDESDRMPSRFNTGKTRSFVCEKGTSIEFCKVASDFLSHLTHNLGQDFRLFYDKVPVYYIPKGHQLKFYLISTLLLQHGVTDEFAVPLILRGLAYEKDWVSLEKSGFGTKAGDNLTKYPFFQTSASFLNPVDLNAIVNSSRLQKVFCLKYLLRILQNSL